MNRLRNILLCLTVFFTQFIPSYAHALPWGSVKATATAAGASVSGSSTVGGAVRTAVATVPWGSLKNGLGKGLKGGGNVLLAAAVYAALNATDYVMDPANNTISYKPTVGGTCASDGSDCQAYALLWSYAGAYFGTPENACIKYAAYWSSSTVSYKNLGGGTYVSDNAYDCNLQVTTSSGTWTETPRMIAGVNPNYDKNAKEEDQRKTITLPDLIQKLIDQMSNNDAAIKNVLDQILETSIAQAQAAENTDADLKAMLAALTAALDKNATYPATGTATGTSTNTATGTDLKLEFPTFCGWAGIVCEAAQTAIDFPSKVTGWWTTVVGWNEAITGWWTTIKSWRDAAVAYVDTLFTEPDLKEEDNTIPDSTAQPQLPTANYINFSQSCPFSNQNNSIEINGQTTNIQNDMSSACDIATQMRPVVLLISALISFGIMAGFNFSGSTQDD